MTSKTLRAAACREFLVVRDEETAVKTRRTPRPRMTFSLVYKLHPSACASPSNSAGHTRALAEHSPDRPLTVTQRSHSYSTTAIHLPIRSSADGLAVAVALWHCGSCETVKGTSSCRSFIHVETLQTSQRVGFSSRRSLLSEAENVLVLR